MRVLLLASLVLTLSGAAKDSPKQNKPEEANPYKADGPVLMDESGSEVWLNTDQLLKSATHCEPPGMPALFRAARIEGLVFVDILVDEKGKVVCARIVSGHPLLVNEAIEAAKNWTFRPKRIHGKPVAFRGHLRFHFSTSGALKDEPRCTVAHW